jgi:hypothetical protein
MKLKIKILTIVLAMLSMLSCEKSDKETVFSKDGRKVSYDLDTPRGNWKDVGEVGTEGIDIRGYVSSSTGGETGNALVTCDRVGKYGYQVVEQPAGACDLEFVTYYENDSTFWYNGGETISDLTKGEIYYDNITEAGTKRFIYMSQGPYTDYNYEIRVRYIEE